MLSILSRRKLDENDYNGNQSDKNKLTNKSRAFVEHNCPKLTTNK